MDDFASDGINKSKSGIIISNMSDHCPYFLEIKTNTPKQDFIKYIFKQTQDPLSLQRFYNYVNNADILASFDTDPNADPNLNYNILEKVLSDAHSKYLSYRKVKFNKYKHKRNKWITSGLIRSIKFRDKLYRDLKRIPSDTIDHEITKQNLKAYNKILNNCIYIAKKNYYHNQFNKFKSDIKSTWNEIKIILNKNTSTGLPSYFEINGSKISNHKDIANSFNEFFNSVGPDLASKIAVEKDKSYKDYLTKTCNTKFTISHTNVKEVSNILKNFQPKTCYGHDNISMKLLQFLSPIISKPLTILINQSISTSIFPDKLKIAKILPLHKKDNTKLIANYRPISILPSLSKIIERVIYNQIYNYFSENNLFYNSQYGFRKKHSTEYACLELVDKVVNYMENGYTPIAFFLDLSKAFDTINYEILICKLQFYGFDASSLNLIKNYLDNRKHYMQIEESKSDVLPIFLGLPQGSILGPLLFLIYLNNFNIASNYFEFILYADDSTLIAPLKSHKNVNVSHMINNELIKIQTWLSVNKLSLNLSKTKFMLFHTNKRKLVNKIPDVMLNNINVERVSKFNFLGINLDENMKWTAHTDMLSNKLSKLIGILNKLKAYLPLETLKILYNSLFLSQLNYGILAWGFETKRIFKLQKKAIRIITRSNYVAHTEPLFKFLNTLKIEDIFLLNILKFYYKFKNNELPQFFQSFRIQSRSEIHNYNTRQKDSLCTSRTTRIFADRCLRNYTPCKILEKVFTHSFQGFCKYIKLQKINSYQIECAIPNCYVCSLH